MIVKIFHENGVWRIWDDISDLSYGDLGLEKTTAEMEDFKNPEDLVLGNPTEEKVEWSWILFFYGRTNSQHTIYFNTKAYIMNNEGKTIEKRVVKKWGATAALPYGVKVKTV